MKSKAPIISAVLVVVVLLIVSFQTLRSPHPSPEPVGRYQLLQARFDLFILTGDLATNNSSVKMEGLFKLDTATGRVWLYREAVAGSNHRQFWQPIEQ